MEAQFYLSSNRSLASPFRSCPSQIRWWRTTMCCTWATSVCARFTLQVRGTLFHLFSCHPLVSLLTLDIARPRCWPPVFPRAQRKYPFHRRSALPRFRRPHWYGQCQWCAGAARCLLLPYRVPTPPPSPPDLPGADSKVLGASLQKILREVPDRNTHVFPGHMQPTVLADECKGNFFLAPLATKLDRQTKN